MCEVNDSPPIADGQSSDNGASGSPVATYVKHGRLKRRKVSDYSHRPRHISIVQYEDHNESIIESDDNESNDKNTEVSGSKLRNISKSVVVLEQQVVSPKTTKSKETTASEVSFFFFEGSSK